MRFAEGGSTMKIFGRAEEGRKERRKDGRREEIGRTEGANEKARNENKQQHKHFFVTMTVVHVL